MLLEPYNHDGHHIDHVELSCPRTSHLTSTPEPTTFFFFSCARTLLFARGRPPRPGRAPKDFLRVLPGVSCSSCTRYLCPLQCDFKIRKFFGPDPPQENQQLALQNEGGVYILYKNTFMVDDRSCFCSLGRRKSVACLWGIYSEKVANVRRRTSRYTSRTAVES